jgi:hypothetical protein
MAIRSLIVSLTCVLVTASTYNPINASIVAGILTYPGAPPTAIGNTTSAINAAIARVYGLGRLSDTSAVLINSTVGLLSYLTLTGTYDADVPLGLPSQLILAMDDATIVASPAFSGEAFIIANGSAFAAVVSVAGPAHALIDCSAALVAATGVLAVNSPFFLLDGVTVSGCGNTGPANSWSAGVHLRGEPFTTGGEVAHCIVRDGSRAIWTETISSVLIHGNYVFNNSKHAIDFDAFSTHGVAFNNSAWNNAEEAVFIEQAASFITVSGNVFGPNNYVGIAVYNNDIGVVTQGHVIVGNTVFGSLSAGISVGSTALHAGAQDVSVTVAGNTLYDNAGQGIHANGGQSGTVYAANVDSDGMSLNAISATYNGNVTAFDPLDRVRVASK